MMWRNLVNFLLIAKLFSKIVKFFGNFLLFSPICYKFATDLSQFTAHCMSQKTSSTVWHDFCTFCLKIFVNLRPKQ